MCSSDLLVVMQHYGAPTRFLDWTKSPWIAVFFAVSTEWKNDGYVFGFSRNDLENSIKKEYASELKEFTWGICPDKVDSSDRMWDKAQKNDELFDPAKVKNMSKWIATFYSRKPHFPRLTAQQGIFTFASKPGLDHWKQIRRLIKKRFSLRIHYKAKPDILKNLNNMGLNGATLFPGADRKSVV